MKTSLNPRLYPLYTLFLDLDRRQDDDFYWYQLNKALNEYFRPDLESEHEALNLLVAEIHRRIEHFIPEDDTLDAFYRKAYLLRLAYNNHQLKLKRIMFASEIRVMKYLATKTQLSTEDEIKLARLIDIRSKL